MRIVILIAFIFCFVGASAQSYDSLKLYRSQDNGWQYKRMKVDSILQLPNGTIINRAWKFPVTDTVSLSNRINLKADKSTSITINGITYNLSANRIWTVGTLTGADTLYLSGSKLNISDTAAMLAAYARLATVTGKLNSTDTASMLAAYLRASDTAFLSSRINAKQNTITLTTTGTTGAATLTGATLNVPNYSTTGFVPYSGATSNVALGLKSLNGAKLSADTSLQIKNRANSYGNATFDYTAISADFDNFNFYTIKQVGGQNYQNGALFYYPSGDPINNTKSYYLPSRNGTLALVEDTVSLSNRINAKLAVTDTVSLSNRINLKADKSTTLTINGTGYDLSANRTWTIPTTDTTSLSDRINTEASRATTAEGLKLNISDTAAMLSAYYKASNPAGYITAAAIAGKLNISDTANIRVRPIAGTNLTITGTYPDLTFNSTSAGGGEADSAYFWKRTGNAATAGSNFLGTVNNTSLRFRTKNIERVVIDSVGNVAIGGQPSASYKMDVVGAGRYSGQLTGTTALFTGNAGFGTSRIGIGGNGAFGGSAASWLEYVSPHFTINNTTSNGGIQFIGHTNFLNSVTGNSNAISTNTPVVNYTGGITSYYNQYIAKLNATGSASVNTAYVRGYYVAAGTITPNSSTIIPIGFQNETGTNLLNSTSGTTLIGGNYSNVDSSAILQTNSTTKGFLQPRMTSTQRNAITTPATGLSVYNTTTNTNDYYNGTAWVSASTSTIDTTSLSNRINTKLNSSDTTNLSNRINLKLNSSDTASLSNRINDKQNTLILTTTGTSGASTLIGATLNIPQYQAAGTYVTSVTGTSPIVSSGGTTPAISIPAATSSVNGYLTSTDWTAFNGKQNAINGTGFVKASGTTISYDNSSYYLASNPNGYTTNTGTVTSIATNLGLIGGTITTTGTLSVDTASVSILSRQRAANTYATKTAYVPYTGATTNVTLGANNLQSGGDPLSDVNGVLLSNGGTVDTRISSTLANSYNFNASRSANGSGYVLSRNGYLKANIGVIGGGAANSNDGVMTFGSYYQASSGSGINDGAFTELMRLNPSGVGNATLDVSGSGKFSGAVTATQGNFNQTATSGFALTMKNRNATQQWAQVVDVAAVDDKYFGLYDVTNSAYRMVVTNGGNTLIGTTTDNGSKLQVSGAATFSGNVGIGTASPISVSGYTGFTVYNPTTGGIIQTTNGTVDTRMQISSTVGYVGAFSNHDLALVAGGSERMRISNGGVVTITNLAGTGSRAVLADASGVLSAPVSDSSVKENIKPLDYGIADIMKLKPVSFEYKKSYKNFGEGKQIGNIAQDMAKVIPEAVFTTPSTGKMGINYDQLNGVYIKALQELQLQIETLKAEIEKLKK